MSDELLPEERKVVALRPLAEASPNAYDVQLADALHALAQQLTRLGRHDEAVAVADEMVDLAEGLHERVGGYERLSGWASTFLAERLRAARRLDEANAVFAEAAEFYRHLFRNNPFPRASYVGFALIQQADVLIDDGRYSDAVALADEAIALFRAIRQEDGSALTDRLAAALMVRSDALWGLDQVDTALDASKRAVNLARAVDNRTIDNAGRSAHLFRLRSWQLSQLDRDADAVTLAEEAVALNRAQPYPTTTVNVDLGLSLIGLAWRLRQADRPADAASAAAEAVVLWRRAHRINATRYVKDLIVALALVALTAADADSAREAVERARSLAAEEPDQTPLLADILRWTAPVIGAVGMDPTAADVPAAVAALTESIELLRSAQPTRDARNALASALGALAGVLSTAHAANRKDAGDGQSEELGEAALTAAGEAVALRRVLYVELPQRMALPLARSVHRWAGCLEAIGRTAEARAARAEGAELGPSVHPNDIATDGDAPSVAHEGIGTTLAVVKPPTQRTSK